MNRAHSVSWPDVIKDVSNQLLARAVFLSLFYVQGV